MFEAAEDIIAICFLESIRRGYAGGVDVGCLRLQRTSLPYAF